MKEDKGLTTQTVERLTLQHRMQLLAGLLSDSALFASARLRLKLEYFTSPDESGLRVLWAVALDLAQKHGIDFLFSDRAQTWNVLSTECQAYLANHPGECPPQFGAFLFDEQNGFLPWLYSRCKPEEFSPKYTAAVLGAFLKERAVSDLLQRLSREAGDRVMVNVSQVVQGLAARDAEAASFASDPVESAAPQGWVPPPIKRRPTGIRWLDAFLRGGHCAPETYGVSGALGSGKTTLALQLVTSVARMELFLADNPDHRGLCGMDKDEPFEAGHCYYFYYEMPKDEIRTKLWSCASGIDWDRIKMLGKKGFKLSTANNLTEDEKKILTVALNQFGAPSSAVALADFPGEQERLDEALKLLARNVWMIDMTGNGANPGQGTGYIPEIAAVLSAEKRKGHKIACVAIDYAQACVDRHTGDQFQKYDLLSQFGRRIEHEVGVPFDTPVWILGQLSGAANQRTAATKQHHSDAAGSKRFAENLWFAFNIGTADEATGCRYWTCSKARRSDLGTSPVLKIAGGGPGRANFNKLIDVSHQFYFEGHNGKVKSKSDKGPGGPKIYMAGGKALNDPTKAPPAPDGVDVQEKPPEDFSK